MDIRWLREYEAVSKLIGGNNVMTFEQVTETLYKYCNDRSNTSKNVFDGVVKDLGLIGASHLEQQALDIIRPYKQTGKNLEITAKALYTLLSTKPEPSGSIFG